MVEQTETSQNDLLTLAGELEEWFLRDTHTGEIMEPKPHETGKILVDRAVKTLRENATVQSYVSDATLDGAIAGLAEIVPMVRVGDCWRILAYLGKHGMIHQALYARIPQYAKDDVNA